jgi:hypothetical protein
MFAVLLCCSRAFLAYGFLEMMVICDRSGTPPLSGASITQRTLLFPGQSEACPSNGT